MLDYSTLPAETELWLKDEIRSIPDFPIPGIDFKDITPVLTHPEKFPVIIDELCRQLRDQDFEAVVAIESRGFVIGAPIASTLRRGLVLVRKPGKLPGERDAFPYTCEYCSGVLEVHRGAIRAGRRYLIVDDLLATGGTAYATADYVAQKGGAVEGFCFLIELTGLDGRARLNGKPVLSLLRY